MSDDPDVRFLREMTEWVKPSGWLVVGEEQERRILAIADRLAASPGPTGTAGEPSEEERKAEAVSRLLGMAIERGMMSDEWPAGFADAVVDTIWAAAAGAAPASLAVREAAARVIAQYDRGALFAERTGAATSIEALRAALAPEGGKHE